MNMTSPSANYEDRLLALEARIAELEQQCEVAQLDIPWHVIFTTVATFMPNVRIIRVAQVPTHRNSWQTSAVLRNVGSHQIR